MSGATQGPVVQTFMYACFDIFHNQIYSMQGREPGRFRSDREIPPNRNLFVVNYDPDGTRREDLEKFFEQWGTVDRVQMKDKYSFIEVRTLYSRLFQSLPACL
jgi:hypothetical protein